MIPTVEHCSSRAAFHLGDSVGRRYSPADLRTAVSAAWEEIVAYMGMHGVASLELTTLYDLPAATSTLLPSEAGISNFGEPIRLWERPAGSAEDWTLLHGPVEVLPQDSNPAQYLGVFRWVGERFEFKPAAGAIQLKIEYTGSGAAPDSGSMGIDDCTNAVAKLAAAIIAPTKGDDSLVPGLLEAVWGGTSPASKERCHVHVLIQQQLKTKQMNRFQMPAYGPNRGGGGRLPARHLVIG